MVNLLNLYYQVVNRLAANNHTGSFTRKLALKRYQLSYSGNAVDVPKYGAKLFLDSNDRVISKSIYYNRVWEEAEIDLFLNAIKKGDTVLDIGSNISWYAILAAKKTGASGHVYAFEPAPNCYRLLPKNIEVNDLTNIKAFNCAVSESSQTQKLFLNYYKNGASPHRCGLFQTPRLWMSKWLQ